MITPAPEFKKSWVEMTEKEQTLSNRYYILNSYEKFLEDAVDKEVNVFVRFAILDMRDAELQYIKQIENGDFDYLWEKKL